MTRQALVIGIGSGDPAQLTGEAVAAMNRVDVFVVADKGERQRDLVELRADLCRSVIRTDRYRFVEVPDPPRGPDRDRDLPAYETGVASWHERRADAYADLIEREVGPDGTVGFLVWGDPSLYDSTLRIVASVAERGVPLEVSVVPGVSSLQLLAARHGIALNQIGHPVHVTTGRRLAAEYSPRLGDVAVLLDGDLACAGLLPAYADLQIFWGAQLGLADEALVAGRLAEVLPEIAARRAALRTARGWVMDTYLLRAARASPSLAAGVRLRPLGPDDETTVRAAQAALAPEGFVFAPGLTPERPWPEYLEQLERERAGVDLAPGRVPGALLLAEVAGAVVGRISVRFTLTEMLRAEGGHLGYCVLPEHRRRGHATEMLRQGLVIARSAGIDPVLVTADETNLSSIRVIDSCGGVLDPDWPRAEGTPPKCRYWIA